MKRVVIVESPTKARTIGQYLGKGFLVLSSRGHVRDLPEDELGVDIENGFAPKWVIRNPRVLSQLREVVSDAVEVYLATDPDREGEAIAHDLMELLWDGKKRFRRILLHEITPKAVREAIRSPGEVDLRKVEAQRTRRILDRLVGYTVSPLLSRSLSGNRFEGLSAGRVQSVALRFICDREIEIQRFVPEEYWEARATFPTEPPFSAKSRRRLGKDEVQGLEGRLARTAFTVKGVEETEVVRRPPPPFITSTLQQAAAAELGFSPARTMRIAQELYEGVEIGGRSVALITYMRTDSVRVSKEAVESAREFISERFGRAYLSPAPRAFRNRRKAQDAHEAIRPTDVTLTPETVAPYLREDQRKVYELIWRRFLATQMADGIWKRRRVILEAGGIEFVATSSWPVFKGFAEVLRIREPEGGGVQLPELVEGQRLFPAGVEVERKLTEPPKRYTEGSLVRKLEQEGIGRPSTYAQIVSVIQERGYVRKEKGALKPTLLGQVVVDFLKAYFPETVQEDFTAEMEERLDRIQEGEAERLQVLGEFYRGLSERLREVEELIEKGSKPFRALTDVPCPECGAPTEVRVWKGDLYLGCSRYPACRGKVRLPPGLGYRYGDDGLIRLVEELKAAKDVPRVRCPGCGAEMVLRHGHYGRYLSCPECGRTAPVPTGIPCPRCGGGELVERYSSKKRRTFYACSNYPGCRFSLPGRPRGRCGECEKGILYEDPRKGLVCSNPDCPSRKGELTPRPGA